MLKNAFKKIIIKKRKSVFSIYDLEGEWAIECDTQVAEGG